MGLILAVAAVLVFLTFFRTEENTAAPDAVPPVLSKTARVQRAPDAVRRSGRAREAKRLKKPALAEKGGRKTPEAGQPAAVVKEEKTEAVRATDRAAEKAVEAWETLVDQMAEMTDAPTRERRASVKEAFDKLGKAYQMDAIQTALNLLPDEQFTSLYGILFDKQENPEVLEEIFNDALNRPEEIKVPLMKELAKDKTHPMFFESARILDATGELDKTDGEEEDGAEAVPPAQ
ncbi:MAG: hypothetical protein PHV28_05705 [Kiritimatiellae bacterium]|nr:hypothetical protein [Kiritimatiellia bacterium]